MTLNENTRLDYKTKGCPFAIYPNSAKEIIFLNFEVNEKDNVTFELYDVLGKQQTISAAEVLNKDK